MRNDHVKGFFAPLKPKLDTAPPMFDFNFGFIPIYTKVINIDILTMLK